MVMTGIHTIDSSINTAKEWLKDIQGAMGAENQEEAYKAARGVLTALRDRLPVGEASNFASQLPLFLVGVYFHGWKPEDKPIKIRHQDEFISAVAERIPQSMEAANAVRSVFGVINKRITAGEIEDVKGNLPQEIRVLWE